MRKRIFIGIGIFLVITFCVIVLCDQSVAYNAKGKTYENVDSIPQRKVGLIFGTSPISTWNGHTSVRYRNVFRALCLDSYNQLALYESQGIVTFGNFIDALLSQVVKEALYTDMGQGWNYCFYRVNQSEKSPKYLHSTSLPYASNFITIKIK